MHGLMALEVSRRQSFQRGFKQPPSSLRDNVSFPQGSRKAVVLFLHIRSSGLRKRPLSVFLGIFAAIHTFASLLLVVVPLGVAKWVLALCLTACTTLARQLLGLHRRSNNASITLAGNSLIPLAGGEICSGLVLPTGRADLCGFQALPQAFINGGTLQTGWLCGKAVFTILTLAYFANIFVLTAAGIICLLRQEKYVKT